MTKDALCDKAALPALPAISREIWEIKYRYVDPADPDAADRDVRDTWRRVAMAAAAAEKRDREAWARRFCALMEDFRFLPGGRILAGAGTKRHVTLFNCFVMGAIDDSIAGIFDILKESALTLQAGGGIGVDFSPIRPKGALVRSIGAKASGPVSFMEVWDAMCRTIMSAGHRRGAMMGTLACDHPDIEAFIEAKARPGRLTNFNLSVLVTDAFMRAVEEDLDWPLRFAGEVHHVVRARALWEKLMRATYDHAEPGVIFIDRVNEKNNLNYLEEIRATNPCGEQPLPPHGACLLGSLNLVKFVRDPFTAEARLDEEALAETVPHAVRLLDDMIDRSWYPLPQQRAEARAKRRIGLGITGLADALAMIGVRYGDEKAARLAERWMAVIERAAYLASADLAVEKGAFPLFDADAYLCGGHVAELDEKVRAVIREKGVRNALLTSIAPTGTISLLAGNVSSGIEPIFAHEYQRRVRQPDGSVRSETVTDHAVALWRRMKGREAPLPDVFVTVADLSWRDHLRMQAAVQKHVDSAISKTVNLPEDISFEEFRDVYRQAWRLGLKGCTTYRPNPITGSVLVMPGEERGAGDRAAASSAERGAEGEGARTRTAHAPSGEICPRCGMPTVQHAEGCARCLSCDSSGCA